jgi:hypothetical protein
MVTCIQFVKSRNGKSSGLSEENPLSILIVLQCFAIRMRTRRDSIPYLESEADGAEFLAGGYRTSAKHFGNGAVAKSAEAETVERHKLVTPADLNSPTSHQSAARNEGSAAREMRFQ